MIGGEGPAKPGVRRISVLVFAPKGAGKTKAAEFLRDGLQLDRVVDNWGCLEMPALRGTLYLTNVTAAEAMRNGRSIRVLSLDSALVFARDFHNKIRR